MGNKLSKGVERESESEWRGSFRRTEREITPKKCSD